MRKEEVLLLLEEWGSAVQIGNAKNVAALYAENAILLPTLSEHIRHNREEIEDYFVGFLSYGPQVKIDESNVQTYSEIAINSGVYTFSLKDKSVLRARFSFVYCWDAVCWRIVEHHSSLMPG